MKYNFDKIINRKNTFSTQWDYIIDRFGTNDITPFSISDTDFKIPVEVAKAIQQAAKLEIYGYTRWNHAYYKGAIVNYYQRRFQTRVDPDHIVYAPSVMYSLSTLMSLLTKAGDYVASFSPMYTDFEDCVLMRKRKMIRVFMNNQDSYYTINEKNLEEALKKAKVFLLCSPHNPTGRVFHQEELDLIVRLCKQYEVAIISDEIHMDITYGNLHIPILNYLEEYKEIYLVSSGSKTFNYPSLGGSYAIIPNDKTRQAFFDLTKHCDFVSSANYMGMIAMVTSYNECDDYVDELNDYLLENMKLVESYINEKCAPLHFRRPEGTYLAWIDCRDLLVDCDTLQKALIDIGKVGIMKGETYFEDHYLRMNIGCPKSKVLTGLQGIEKAVHYLLESK